MPYTICHFSDLHLERSFARHGTVSATARHRRAGLRDALEAICTLANARACDALTIGGDLFDDESATVETGQFLTTLLGSLAPMRVFIAPGNHDPYINGSLYMTMDWPSNVHIFTAPELHPIRLTESLVLWGLAHPDHMWEGNPLSGPTLEPSNDVHLALFHGAERSWLAGIEGKSKHGPFAAADIQRKGFVGALCGHYHSYRLDRDSGLLYPGTPEPLAVDETGDHGPTIVTVADNGEFTCELVPLQKWHALECTVDITSSSSLSSLTSVVLTGIQDALGHRDPQRTILQLDLIGTLPSYMALDCDVLHQTIIHSIPLATLTIRTRTQPALDLDSLMKEHTVRGRFVGTVLSEIEAHDREDPEREMLERALKYGLNALQGNEVLHREI
ncbi:MAG: metallophosphoesterase family protein [Candidatus Dormibacteria bacterium]